MTYLKNKNNFPIIDLGDYILREQTIDDAADFFKYYSDPEVNKYVVSDIPNSIEEAKTEISYWINVFYNNDGIYFGIVHKATDQQVGSIGLSGMNYRHNRIEASYDLAKEHWNLGITTKALKAVLKYGFEEMNINRIEAFSLSENIGSRKVLLKSGFNLEGELKQHRMHRGSYTDIGIFSIIYEDYLKQKNEQKT